MFYFQGFGVPNGRFGQQHLAGQLVCVEQDQVVREHPVGRREWRGFVGRPRDDQRLDQQVGIGDVRHLPRLIAVLRVRRPAAAAATTPDRHPNGRRAAATGTRRRSGPAQGQTLVQIRQRHHDLRGEKVQPGNRIRQECGQTGTDHEIRSQRGGKRNALLLLLVVVVVVVVERCEGITEIWSREINSRRLVCRATASLSSGRSKSPCT